jgi:hypothetical protein
VLAATGRGDRLAELVAGEPRTPNVRTRTALATARAISAEAAGDLADASARYAACAEAWLAYGSIPERGRALLGEGRCRLALGEPGAASRLQEARGLFAALGAAPLMLQVDVLLGDEAAAIS